MPINIRWFDDTKRVILWEIQGQWTLDEMHEAYTTGTKMCLEVPENTVNALIDVTGSKTIPSNIFGALSSRSRTSAINYDMAVLVSNNSLIKAFASALNSLPRLRENFMVVGTREEALDYIEKRRLERESVKP